MVYELHNQRVLRYFEENGRMDDLLVFDIDALSDEQTWSAIMDFVGCADIERIAERVGYPHVNPTLRVFSEIELVPDDYALDWDVFFEHKIPILRAQHKPHRKIWLELINGDYRELI